jgi:hypothetical protein
MLITRTSPVTKITATLDIDITEEQMFQWLHGTLIQDAMSNISADEREFIKTGLQPDDWEYLMGEEL